MRGLCAWVEGVSRRGEREAWKGIPGGHYLRVLFKFQVSYSPLTDLNMLEDVPFLMYKSRRAEELIVVEGLLDALLIDQIGIKPVVAIGKSGLSTRQMDALCEYGTRHCIICLGSPKNRKRATTDAAELIRARGLSVSVLPLEDTYSDIDEFIRSNDLNLFRKLLAKPVSFEEWAAKNK